MACHRFTRARYRDHQEDSSISCLGKEMIWTSYAGESMEAKGPELPSLPARCGAPPGGAMTAEDKSKFPGGWGKIGARANNPVNYARAHNVS